MDELRQSAGQALQAHAIGITFGLAVALLVVGAWLISVGGRAAQGMGGGADENAASKRDLGVALVVGSLFFGASLFVQLSAEADNFRMTIAISKDLTGFDPNGRSLRGMTFAGKNLNRAKLKGADLERADLSTAFLGEAHLEDADLRDANLFYAILFRAVLRNTDLTGADLRGAELSAGVLGAKLEGARVHRETCWQMKLEDQAPLPSEGDAQVAEDNRPILEKLTTAGLKPMDGRTLGHVCDSHEQHREVGTPTGQPDQADEVRVYICKDGALRPRTVDERDSACND
jgi:uncharacterized protein YjbI with pentapeptide repeats